MWAISKHLMERSETAGNIDAQQNGERMPAAAHLANDFAIGDRYATVGRMKMKSQETGQSSDVHRYPKRAHAVRVAPEPAIQQPIAAAIDPIAQVAAGGYALVPLEWLNVIMSDTQIREALAKHAALKQHLEWRMRAGQDTLERPTLERERPIERAIERSSKPGAKGRTAATWSLVKGAKAPSGRSESASRIYTYLADHREGATVSQLMTVLAMPLSTVQNGLRQLQYAGSVNQSGGR